MNNSTNFKEEQIVNVSSKWMDDQLSDIQIIDSMFDDIKIENLSR